MYQNKVSYRFSYQDHVFFLYQDTLIHSTGNPKNTTCCPNIFNLNKRDRPAITSPPSSPQGNAKVQAASAFAAAPDKALIKLSTNAASLFPALAQGPFTPAHASLPPELVEGALGIGAFELLELLPLLTPALAACRLPAEAQGPSTPAHPSLPPSLGAGAFGTGALELELLGLLPAEAACRLPDDAQAPSTPAHELLPPELVEGVLGIGALELLELLAPALAPSLAAWRALFALADAPEEDDEEELAALPALRSAAAALEAVVEVLLDPDPEPAVWRAAMASSSASASVSVSWKEIGATSSSEEVEVVVLSSSAVAWIVTPTGEAAGSGVGFCGLQFWLPLLAVLVHARFPKKTVRAAMVLGGMTAAWMALKVRRPAARVNVKVRMLGVVRWVGLAIAIAIAIVRYY